MASSAVPPQWQGRSFGALALARGVGGVAGSASLAALFAVEADAKWGVATRDTGGWRVALAAAVARNNATAMWHRDAGTYFCNELYFRTLFAVRAKGAVAATAARAARADAVPGLAGALLPAVFVHLLVEF